MCLMVRSRIIESEIGGYNDDGLCESREFKHEVVVLDAIYGEGLYKQVCLLYRFAIRTRWSFYTLK